MSTVFHHLALGMVADGYALSGREPEARKVLAAIATELQPTVADTNKRIADLLRDRAGSLRTP